MSPSIQFRCYGSRPESDCDVTLAFGQYVVAGADTAMYIRKDQRAKYSKLYVKHDERNCRNAAAMRAAAQRRKVGAQIPRNVVKFDRRRVSR